jgi:hypothetical protein
MVVTLIKRHAKHGDAGTVLDLEDADGMSLIRAGVARNPNLDEINSLTRNLTADEARSEMGLGSKANVKNVRELTGAALPGSADE